MSGGGCDAGHEAGPALDCGACLMLPADQLHVFLMAHCHKQPKRARQIWLAERVKACAVAEAYAVAVQRWMPDRKTGLLQTLEAHQHGLLQARQLAGCQTCRTQGAGTLQAGHQRLHWAA